MNIEQQIEEAFNHNWVLVHKPLSSTKKGYKNGRKDGFIAGAKWAMENLQEQALDFLDDDEREAARIYQENMKPFIDSRKTKK